MRGQNAPNWAILGEQGEFCPAHAVRRGVQGEFCPGSGPAWFLLGEFCSAMVPSVSPVTGLPSPTGTATRPRRPPRAFHISTDTTEAGPRRIPPLVACGGRAVGAEKPAPETQRPSLSSETTVAVVLDANAQFFHQPLTVSTAWAPRSDSAEWALTRPEDRRAAWKREATFSQFTRFHQALT